MRTDPTRRFWAKVSDSTTGACRLWLGAKTPNGYGKFWLDGRLVLSHRVAYEFANGAIPADLTIDHLCRNRACVNPVHLEAVPLSVNLARSTGLTAQNSRKTHCPQGHAYSGPNTYLTPAGGRACRACRRQRAARYRASQKEISYDYA